MNAPAHKTADTAEADGVTRAVEIQAGGDRTTFALSEHGDAQARAQAMVQRAWAELGVAMGPTGRPLDGWALEAGLGPEGAPPSIVRGARVEAGRPDAPPANAGSGSEAAAADAGGEAGGWAGLAGAGANATTEAVGARAAEVAEAEGGRPAGAGGAADGGASAADGTGGAAR
jgi:hypothetical protein